MPPIIKTYRQDPPFCIQIELVEGCNLRCPFCGLNGIRGKLPDLKCMTLQTIQSIGHNIESTGWNSRIEFAMHGEPSLHPRLIEMLQNIRKILPKHSLMMTSNGAAFAHNPQLADLCLEYLNVLGIEAYEHSTLCKRFTDRYKGDLRFYPRDKKANPHRRRKLSEHEVVIIQDIAKATKGTHASLNNHAGSGSPPNNRAVGKRCAKPFRELSIRWDGNVAICCNDWRGIYKCGNVLEQSLTEIWHSPSFVAARRKLYWGLRDFGPCLGCDALSYRPGLLPDQRGKRSVPRPTASDLKAIEKALSGQSYTTAVLRPWER